MKITHEMRVYEKNNRVWAGKYRNSQNLPHWHYDCELIYAESGSLDVMCDKRPYTISAGQAFFIDSEQLHYISARSPETRLITIFFTYDIIRPFALGSALLSPVLKSDYGVEEVYSRLKTEFKNKKLFYETGVQLIISELMLDIFRGEQLVQKRAAKTTESFKNLLKLMNDRYEFLTSEEAANYMGMNLSYFSRFFHSLAGMPFSKYLNCIKVDKAVNLLHASPEKSKTEIATECGFSTIRNFNRVFKELTGFSPSEVPDDFILDESLARLNSTSSNPTLGGCELIENSNDL